jgi:hypothetical protein
MHEWRDTMSLEYIRKLMGWCPNAKAFGTQHSTCSDYLEANHQSRGRDNEYSENPSWFRKISSRLILFNTFFTIVYILIISHWGVNLVALLSGCSIGIVIFVSEWQKQMHFYDTISQKLFFDQSNTWLIRHNKITKLIPFAMLICLIFLEKYVKPDYIMQFIGSFATGFLLYMWLGYFRLIHWEKINHKIIFFSKRCGKYKRSYFIRGRK